MTSCRRVYREFVHREAVFRICCDEWAAVEAEIVRQRGILEAYIREHPEFGTSLIPVAATVSAPVVAQRMAMAAAAVGVGPMAAVAGAMAQLAAEAGLAAGAAEAIIDNGGDVYAAAASPVVIALYAGDAAIGGRLAFEISPPDLPLAVCSSSGKMGHSMSLGQCDLATVVAGDAALADAAATAAANRVSTPDDIDAALATISDIEGVQGVLIAHADRVGMAGRLPRLRRGG